MPARKSQNRKQNGGARGTMSGAEMRAVKTLKNGAQGRFKIENGKKVFRIIKGASTAQMVRVRSARGKAPRALSAKAARAALTRHFNRKKVSPRGRAIAMGREMCRADRPSVRDTRYSKKGGPGRFNFPGLDDGSNCKGTVRRQSKKASAKQAAALAKGRAVRARNLRMGRRT